MRSCASEKAVGGSGRPSTKDESALLAQYFDVFVLPLESPLLDAESASDKERQIRNYDFLTHYASDHDGS